MTKPNVAVMSPLLCLSHACDIAWENILQDLQDLQCKIFALFLYEMCTNLASLQESCTENVLFLVRVLEILQDIFPWVCLTKAIQYAMSYSTNLHSLFNSHHVVLSVCDHLIACDSLE